MKSAGVVLAVMLAASCGGKPAPVEPTHNVAPPTVAKHEPAPELEPSPDDPAYPLFKMAQFTKEVCACAPGDAACATRSSDHLTKWATDMAKTTHKEVKPSEELMKQIQLVMESYTKCMTAAMTPATPPPATP